MRETWESFLEDALHPDDLEVFPRGFRETLRNLYIPGNAAG